MKVAKYPEACYGCRMCELACSFHHNKVFAPESSSVKVSPNWLSGEIQLSIDSTCDLCEGEAQPLCVEYCLYGALKEVNESECKDYDRQLGRENIKG